MDTVRLQTIKDDALNFSEMTAAVVARWEGIMNEHAPPQEDDDEKERLWLDSAKNLNHLSMEKKVNPPPAKATTSSSQKETEEEEEARLAEEERQQQAALQRQEDDEKELELILQLIFDVRLLSVEKGAHSMTRKTTTLTTTEENEVIGATILAARTLSCTAPGDHCAQLCVDLLWSLALQAPTTLTRVLLYDNEEGAVEWLFLSLVNLLNQSHRSMERDLRNDLVTFFTLLLKTDGQVWREKLARYADENDNSFDEAELLNSLSPPPAATIDAINAFVLLLLDLSCGTELNAPLLSSNDDSRGNNNNSIQHAATRNPLLTQKGRSCTPCALPVWPPPHYVSLM
ncbi:hypothetical protein AGDE_15772 [Angomonas deanei]|uniref:Uncharacterized protein n=1 Tax=Angomonas deanei TaxID=59799 RepID=A0A7G2CBU2_9TRYP|nr:hypothetical protein AGDE_15772 [Angomonas deanei]CAD2216925.1 hypothetical protein, conserved [Angomonas deanei]|eukprot:EPY18497.1 hypothetical protein AGDE_15772 [Angomonas deanei]